ncbi:MAG: T9SS type A sorting domain-containing protein [Crocinitomicaceae bacterium]
MKLILLGILFVLATNLSFAQPYAGKEGKKFVPAKAAGCTPPNTSTTMEFNNVRMLVHTAGNLWQRYPQNNSMYEVPKNSGIMCLFTSALWLGGTDANGQLKLAALRYRDGQDYWTGPLIQTTAEVNSAVCNQYDKHFVTSKDDVQTFVAWYKAGIEDQQNGTSNQSSQFPGYKVPDIIKNWPAHGDVALGQDQYLAPFFDYNEDGLYNWEDGDYPWHDIYKTKNCETDRRVSLYGDLNYWWVMNDKGNIHTETGADPIGMEIRAQAFAFASNDEINNMTFYNYELINRGSLTLYNTYFGFFTDGALGNPYDDFVGCDVNRGLGYYYNGNNFDTDISGFKGYGSSPPAVGVDFFEGPYQDDDGVDNAFGIGEGEALNGIGYGDGIVDNERFGMRRFLYYSNSTNGAEPSQTDPIGASDYYNYLRGYWKDGSPFYYGGSGHISDPEANPNRPCDFMFPGDTDPLGWGTGGYVEAPWTEQTAGNTPNDRRFLQSAGPFVLKPGAVNNITVGVAWARSAAGDPFASVEVLRRADDKAQALFENCFRIIEAPHAPNLQIQELNNELLLFLSNTPGSNNYKEAYEEEDPFIVSPDPNADKTYNFQGYQIFQLASAAVSSSELEDKTKARLVAQCDIKDGVGRLINFEWDEVLLAGYPIEKVNGEDKGIRHSFQITEDAFAQGNRTLVNFKRYYYMAIAYAYNNYSPYAPGDPLLLDGQKKVYLPSRKAAVGEIKVIEAIPHNPAPEAGGTLQLSKYGQTPKITRLDGHGNGGRVLELTAESENAIVDYGFLSTPEYQSGKGPINVKVIDPLNVVDGYFELEFKDYTTNAASLGNAADTARWVVHRYDSKNSMNLLESISSEQMINVDNEQLIPQWGVSVQINQTNYFTEVGSGSLASETTDLLESSLTFADSSKRWLSTISDDDSRTPYNWIRSGNFDATPAIDNLFPPNFLELYESGQCYKDEAGKDPSRRWTKVLNGGMAPHQLVGYQCDFMPLAYWKNTPSYPNSPESSPGNARLNAAIAFSPSIDIVITSDRSKWTKCPVLELGRDATLNVGGAKPGGLRKSPSLDRNGNVIAGSTGMSYFPGYAIDIETGARLNMAFGENSFLGQDGGNDMKWEPSTNVVGQTGNPLLGGMHPIYVFSHKQKEINGYSSLYDMGFYTDNSTELKDLIDLMESGNSPARINFYSSLTWIGYPIRSANHKMFETDVRIRVRVNKEYKNFTATGQNGGQPKYAWSMADLVQKKDVRGMLAEALNLINVVPNPYYAYSEYERNRLDNRVKITNLPEVCTIQIFNTNGRLVKTFKKSSSITYQDWDLTNAQQIPVASGIYLIHVIVPDVGERVVKLFLAARSPDYQGL